MTEPFVPDHFEDRSGFLGTENAQYAYGFVYNQAHDRRIGWIVEDGKLRTFPANFHPHGDWVPVRTDLDAALDWLGKQHGTGNLTKGD